MVNEPSLYIGCACVVHDGAGRYLLVRETKAIARGRLAMPGGKLEVDESIPAAAAREVLEETGLSVELDGLLGIFHCERTSENSFGVNFVFGAHVVSGELTPTEEHPELLWLTGDQIVESHKAGKIRGAHVIEAVQRLEADHWLPAGLITTVAGNPSAR